MLVSEERRQPGYHEKNLSEQRRELTKTQPTYGTTPGFEPRPHWWEASALTTVPPLLPACDDDDDDDDDNDHDNDDSQRESSLSWIKYGICVGKVKSNIFVYCFRTQVIDKLGSLY